MILSEESNLVHEPMAKKWRKRIDSQFPGVEFDPALVGSFRANPKLRNFGYHERRGGRGSMAAAPAN